MSDLRVSVPPQFRRDPDLPLRIAGLEGYRRGSGLGAGAVFLDADHPSARTVARGMPRSLRDLVGRVTSAWWADDDEVGVEVQWTRLGWSGEFVAQLIADGHAKLVWDGREVLAVALPVTAENRG